MTAGLMIYDSKGRGYNEEQINQLMTLIEKFQTDGVYCTWPDCGHDTNQVGYAKPCTGKFCPTRPPGFGIACTVIWTEIVQAMRADGFDVPDKSGPRMTDWIKALAADTLKSQDARGVIAAIRVELEGDEAAEFVDSKLRRIEAVLP